MTPAELTSVLAAHLKWVRGEEGGIRANLRDANLGGANLEGADLRDANLRGAYLEDAYLGGANLVGATMIDGRKWEDYSADHLAGICQTPEVKAKAIAAWGAHSWQDCPMHCALGIDDSAQAENPVAVTAWVALYDSNLLSKPELLATQAVTP